MTHSRREQEQISVFQDNTEQLLVAWLSNEGALEGLEAVVNREEYPVRR